MKRVFFFIMMIVYSIQTYADGLEGQYQGWEEAISEIRVNIKKTNVYVLEIYFVDQNGINIYATSSSIIKPNSFNSIEISLVNKIRIQGESPDLPDGGFLCFSADNGKVDYIELIMGLEHYYLERSKSIQEGKTSTNRNTYNSTNYNKQQEERVPNISVTFGRKGGWTYRLNSNGTFSYHNYTTDSKGNKKNDISITHGTYFMTKGYRDATGKYGGYTVHFRYENGKQEIAHLRYEGNRAVLISKIYGGVGKRNEEMVGEYY